MIRFLIALFTCVLMFASPLAALAEPTVFVSIPPQQYFAEKIADGAVDVEVMVLPSQSPATYEPSPRQMAALSDAAGYLAIGVPFENAWLHRFEESSPGLKIFHVDEGIKKRSMKAHHHHGEEEHAAEHHQTEEHHHAEHQATEHHAEAEHEADHHEHEHTGLDPHVWLSPQLAKTIARNTCDALIDIVPEKKAEFHANLETLLAEIDSLDSAIRETLAPIPEDKRKFLVFHPSWGYFAQAYGLEQMPIEMEGKEPGPAELAHIVDRARDEGVVVIFVQPQFSTKSAQVVANEIGGSVEKLDPLAPDWAANLHRAATAFKKALH